MTTDTSREAARAEALEALDGLCRKASIGANPFPEQRTLRQYIESTPYPAPASAGTVPGWMPIETAPRDGTHVLLYRPEIQFVGYYAVNAGCWCVNAKGLPPIVPPPTHWKHLDAAPGEPVEQPTLEDAYAEGRADELADCKPMLAWAYAKLHRMNFAKQEDALMLDRINNLLQYGMHT